MRLSLAEVLKATGRDRSGPALPASLEITGVRTDSRLVQPGDLFVPLRGPRADGHDFIAEAFRRGATASLASRSIAGLPNSAVIIPVDDPLRALGQIAAAYRRTLPLAVVGITGSVGKTTTAQLCASILGQKLSVAVTKDDWNAEIGVPLTLLGLTPQHRVVVLEMAMRALGQIAELVEIAQPSIGVVTTIGEAHLEFLGSRENIARAKGELIAGLPANGVAVLNRDDEWVARLAPLCKGRVMTYGLDGEADVTASQVRIEPSGMAFRLRAGAETADVHLPVWGRHNVSNALAAASVGVTLGLDVGTISAGCAAWKPPKMRLEPVRVGEVLILNDAYNSSPASARAAFDVLADVARGGRMLAVLGAMKELGPQSAEMHRAVGRDVARRHIAALLTVGEGAEAIGEGAVAAGMDRSRVEHARTVEDAGRTLRAMLQPKDVVLIKGSRAVEMERIVDMLRTAHRTAT
ncbi:MAG TPA: UDP-N-acetylmuramoyl-tripeptide--D-alanyl-D-alanine ligase [bacterium]|nr:UDP-N-acetylmuramoyl-tripeptide--D-alanyl-D-alanine ligase [bacterium]